MQRIYKKIFDKKQKFLIIDKASVAKGTNSHFLATLRQVSIERSQQMSKQKINLFVGSIGAFIGIFVFIAYIPQIFANLQGDKAQPFQPLFAAVSCLIWVIYGWTKEPKKDWILIVPNSAGVILGGLTFLTAL